MGILLIALAIRVLGVTYDYPFVLDIDEVRLMQSTNHMLSAHSLDPQFYVYGPLLDYIEALWLLPYMAVRAVLGLPPTPIIIGYQSWTATTTDPLMHVYGRLIFVLIGVAAVWLAFLVGRRLEGVWTGLLAAAFLALSPLHAYQSHFFLPNAPTSFFTLATTWWVLRYVQEPHADRAPIAPAPGRRSWRDRLLDGESANLVLATVAASLGASIKYNAVLILIAPLYAAYLERRGYRQSWPLRCVRLCAVALLVFLAVTPPALVNTVAFVRGAAYQIKVYAVYGGDDPTPSILWNGGYLIGHEGLLLFPLAVVGLAVLIWKERRPADLVLLAAIAVYYLFLGVQKAHFDRNLLVILPLISVAGAYTLARIARSLRPLGLAASCLLTAIILTSLGGRSLDQTRAMLAPSPQLVTRSWLDKHLPPGARLLADPYTVPPLDRPDVSTTYLPFVRLTPEQLWRQGFTFAVFSKALAYYDQPGTDRLSSPTVDLVPVYWNGSIAVFKLVPHRA